MPRKPKPLTPAQFRAAKRQVMSALGKGNLKLPKEKRVERARLASLARWAKAKKAKEEIA